MKKGVLIGHGAQGLDEGIVRALVIPIDAPSIFRDVVASRLPYRGTLPESPANSTFAETIGGVIGEVVLMPISVRERTIAVVFAESAGMPLPDAALHAVCREAGLAYERLILSGKTT